ncbi:low affinity immunoglobulin epsilon Fc receptor-like [Patiria miniata]|uniref:C-type lectin domain-containing protein n=1 Tax=Patiria miniata TaxID=46514 RepID=A0A914BC14_PATMI|nr:low affinity immunoglobulin epsilon Fc receptor-like [Patiria miniata]
MNVQFSLVLLLTLFSCRSETVCVCPTCPDGWSLMDNYCYRFYPQEEEWQMADAICNQVDETKSSSLVSIHSVKENKFVGKLAGKARSWIGLNDRFTEGKFEYTDGSPFTYDAFPPPEPNNAGRGENCVEINNSGTLGRWNDHRCSVRKPFICQMWPTYKEK